MPSYHLDLAGTRHGFAGLAALLAAATPLRSGDVLAGIAADSAEARVAARYILADLPLAVFLHDLVIPYETDEVSRLIIDGHDVAAFAPVAALTVGGLREWLLSNAVDGAAIAAVSPGLTPEMVAAVSKLMRNQDLIAVARKIRVVTAFRNTLGLPGRLSTRLQPNHPTDDPAGIAAAILDGLLLGSGDACIGINPAGDGIESTAMLLALLDDIRQGLGIPTQSCVLAHVTTTLALMARGAPVDLVFQSIAGSEAANRGFGIDLALLAEAADAARALARGSVGGHALYFETGQGSALSAGAHHGVDQQTMECRAYGVARRFRPLLVNSVVGFIGPEYLYDGKQILRAALEDHCCGKLLGLPMGVDICHTNHAEADADDMDAILTLLGVAGINFIMGVPGADDIMLNYQSTSFHDALYLRETLGLQAAPEFAAWQHAMGLVDAAGRITGGDARALARAALPALANRLADVPDLWLQGFTQARVGLGRVGQALPTAALLDVQLAHARARDAVKAGLDIDALAAALGQPVVRVRSAAGDPATHLQRPDLGRRLDPDDAALLLAGEWDLAIVIGDGLSAPAVAAHAAPVVAALVDRLPGWCIAPLVVARHARVALGDDIGAALGARLVLVLIGERPGLSAPDSLGAYLTFAPHRGCVDSQRNCVSNIRPPHGLGHDAAAGRLAWLLHEARRRGLTGVALKEAAPALPG